MTITPETIKWIGQQVANGHFADRSHAIQFALLKVKDLLDKGEIKF